MRMPATTMPPTYCSRRRHGRSRKRLLLIFSPAYCLFFFGALGLTLFFSTNCVFLFGVGPPLLVIGACVTASDGDISLRQATFSGLTSLCLCIPLFLMIPLLRTGWIILLRAISATWVESIAPAVQPWGILAWLFVDSFFLQSFLQETVKLAVCTRALKSAWHQSWRGLVVHGVVAACAIAAVEAGLEGAMLKRNLRGMERLFEAIYSSQTALRDPAIAHKNGMTWAYAMYHGAYCYFSQAFLGAIVACETYRHACLENQSGASFPVDTLRWPTFLHGTPLFLAHLIRAHSQSEVFRFISKSSSGNNLHDLSQLASTTALCEVTLFVTMVFFLILTLSAARSQIKSLARDTKSAPMACQHGGESSCCPDHYEAEVERALSAG